MKYGQYPFCWLCFFIFWPKAQRRICGKSQIKWVYGFSNAKNITAYQRLGYNSLMWYTGLPVRHGLPNPILAWTNERTHTLSSVIAKLSYVLFYWSRPHVALAIHAIMRGWVSSSYFLQIVLISAKIMQKHICIYPGGGTFDSLKWLTLRTPTGQRWFMMTVDDQWWYPTSWFPSIFP